MVFVFGSAKGSQLPPNNAGYDILGPMMTLEQINDIEDKETRLKLLRGFMTEGLEHQSKTDSAVQDEEIGRSRDEAGGMMSNQEKPVD